MCKPLQRVKTWSIRRVPGYGQFESLDLDLSRYSQHRTDKLIVGNLWWFRLWDIGWRNHVMIENSVVQTPDNSFVVEKIKPAFTKTKLRPRATSHIAYRIVLSICVLLLWSCRYIQCTDLHGCNVSCCRNVSSDE